jgi:hypothetical protein
MCCVVSPLAGTSDAAVVSRSSCSGSPVPTTITRGRQLRQRLIRQFQRLFEGPPAGAWPFTPSIPFIGERCRPGCGLLIYASAENLAHVDPAAPERRYLPPAS